MWISYEILINLSFLKVVGLIPRIKSMTSKKVIEGRCIMKKQKGFTLIELLVVIAIIGLLSTLAVVSLNNARQKSRDAKRVADVKQITTALELYYNDKNGYPLQAAWLNIGGSTAYNLCSDTASFATACGTGATVTTYIKVPAAPTPIDTTACADHNPYSYISNSTTAATAYSIKYCLGADTGGVTAGVHSATQSGLY